MSAPQPIILVISGGWLTPQSYAKLTEALSASGFEVHVPALLSISGARPPTDDLESDTALIRSYAENLINNDRELLVLMHSLWQPSWYQRPLGVKHHCKVQGRPIWWCVTPYLHDCDSNCGGQVHGGYRARFWT